MRGSSSPPAHPGGPWVPPPLPPLPVGFPVLPMPWGPWAPPSPRHGVPSPWAVGSSTPPRPPSAGNFHPAVPPVPPGLLLTLRREGDLHQGPPVRLVPRGVPEPHTPQQRECGGGSDAGSPGETAGGQMPGSYGEIWGGWGSWMLGSPGETGGLDAGDPWEGAVLGVRVLGSPWWGQLGVQDTWVHWGGGGVGVLGPGCIDASGGAQRHV